MPTLKRRVASRRFGSRLRRGSGVVIAAVVVSATTADAAPEVSPRGRIHLDAAYHFRNQDAPFADGLTTRRIRLGLDGDLDAWQARIEFDFAEEGIGAREVRARRDIGRGRLWIGQLKVPMSLDELTISNDTLFLERSTPATIIADGFRLGLAYSLDDDPGGLMAMGFGRAIGDSAAGTMPHGLAGRGYLSPSVGPHRLHVGLSAAFEHRGDATTVAYGDRPEARGADGGTRLIDTGPIDDLRSTLKAGAELAVIAGPLSAEAEYLGVRLDRDGESSLYFDGFYLQGSFVMTGESRRYDRGSIRRPTPERSSGALELATRFSQMRLGDGDVGGGTQQNLTLGLNWHLSDQVRFMWNIVFSRVRDGVYGDERVFIALARAQFTL